MQVMPINLNITSPVLNSIEPASVTSKKLEQEKIDETENKKVESVFEKLIKDVNETHIEANKNIEGLIKGDEGVSMHNIMISMQESQMSTQFLLEVRNKLFDCYQELNRVSL